MQEGCLQEYTLYTPEKIKRRIGQVVVLLFFKGFKGGLLDYYT
jgi:hypothetical protein